jgi:hypothetical protein
MDSVLWHASCSCGWTGPERPFSRVAQQDLEDHLHRQPWLSRLSPFSRSDMRAR